MDGDKLIYIVGLGPGNTEYILKRATDILKEADYILGFERALKSLDFIYGEKVYMKKLSDLDKFIIDKSEYENKIICIVASGDPTFYGITNYIKNKTTMEFEIIPGISSFQYLTSKVKLPWNNAVLGSLHGRKDEFLKKVNENNMTIWLTDKENNPCELCKILHKNNVDCTVIIGENLSYDDEVISIGKPKEFINGNFEPLNIFIVIQE